MSDDFINQECVYFIIHNFPQQVNFSNEVVSLIASSLPHIIIFGLDYYLSKALSGHL